MNQQELTDRIIKELVRGRSENDIVMDLCESLKMPYENVKRLVQDVKLTQSRNIAKRQSPIIIALGIGAIILGIGLIFVSIIKLLDGERIFTAMETLLVGLGLIAGGIIGLWNLILEFLKKD